MLEEVLKAIFESFSLFFFFPLTIHQLLMFHTKNNNYQKNYQIIAFFLQTYALIYFSVEIIRTKVMGCPFLTVSLRVLLIDNINGDCR